MGDFVLKKMVLTCNGCYFINTKGGFSRRGGYSPGPSCDGASTPGATGGVLRTGSLEGQVGSLEPIIKGVAHPWSQQAAELNHLKGEQSRGDRLAFTRYRHTSDSRV